MEAGLTLPIPENSCCVDLWERFDRYSKSLLRINDETRMEQYKHELDAYKQGIAEQIEEVRVASALRDSHYEAEAFKLDKDWSDPFMAESQRRALELSTIHK